MITTNRVKQRLQAGNKAVVCWLHLSSPIAAEIVAQAGYDGVLIDHEHGPGDFLNAIALIQASAPDGCTPLMRVPWNDPVYIKRALDIGVQGVMVPNVQSAEEAAAAVAACRYPPKGIRGMATQIARCADYGASSDDYIEGWNEQLLVIVQIETPRAVDNAAAIAAVEGVDMLFVGPSDLSASAGHTGDLGHPDVAALIGEVEARTRAAGKWLGSIPLPGRDARRLFADGYDLVISASDVSLLRLAGAADRAESGL
jgi:4-hydroxy-2-oxoheptanedioate aldolase